jgi:hypothetical protein
MPRVHQPSPQLRATLVQQHGVLTLDQLMRDGFSRRAADSRVERRRWRRLLPGVFLTAPAAPTRRQLLVAAHIWAGGDTAIDAGDACVWYGLTPPNHDPAKVHVVAPSAKSLRSKGFVVVRETDTDVHVGARGTVPYVDAATAVIVASRNLRSQRPAIALLARALQLGLVTSSALREARSAIGSRGCGGVDAALVAVGIGLRSPAEKLGYDLIMSSRVLPEPRWNQWLDLGDGGNAICVDALIEDAAIAHEVLGKRYHAWGEQFESTEERRLRVTAAGLIPTGATARQLQRDAPAVLERLERTYLQNRGRGMPPGVRLIPPPIPQ